MGPEPTNPFLRQVAQSSGAAVLTTFALGKLATAVRAGLPTQTQTSVDLDLVSRNKTMQLIFFFLFFFQIYTLSHEHTHATSA